MSASESKTPNSGDSSFGDQFGANEWLVDEMYERYLQDPSSVDTAWHAFFADFKPSAHENTSPPVSGTPRGGVPPTPKAAQPLTTPPAAAQPLTTP
ncbi:MAG: hypothetical protein AABY37_06970, partial [Actinomycetota bacterium]